MHDGAHLEPPGGCALEGTRHGRFAAVTNFRGPDAGPAEPISRGRLVGDFLLGDASGEDYVARVADAADRYRGFNLLAGTGTGLYYFANRGDVQPRLVVPGVHALSNHLLNSPWPKVERARAGLRELLQNDDIDTGAVMDLLRDDTRAAADELPDTGVDAALESELSPIFIRTEAYGTRCSTLLSIDTRGEVRFIERTFVDRHPQADKQFQFRLSPAVSDRAGAELRSGS